MANLIHINAVSPCFGSVFNIPPGIEDTNALGRTAMRRPLLSVSLFAIIAIAGCSKPEAPKEALAAPAEAGSDAITWPVSINAIMVSMVDHASDAIWEAATKPPKTEAQWRQLEYHAYEMAVAGDVIRIAGTGVNDRNWVADPEWKAAATAMGAAGVQALKLAQAKDAAGFQTVGEALSDSCDACHTKYKPGLPSMGIVHEPDFPRADSPKGFK